jgi:hypothetical protein
MTEIHDVKGIALLRQHAAGKDQVSPIKVVVAQPFGVSVDQSY